MRMVQVEVESAKGRITFRREGRAVVATATVGGRTTTWRITGRTHEDQMAAARRVQRMLDGFRGTGCDVADYLRLIQALLP